MPLPYVSQAQLLIINFMALLLKEKHQFEINFIKGSRSYWKFLLQNYHHKRAEQTLKNIFHFKAIKEGSLQHPTIHHRLMATKIIKNYHHKVVVWCAEWAHHNDNILFYRIPSHISFCKYEININATILPGI